MRSISTTLFFLFFSAAVSGQVGLNTTSPNAQLDIRSSNQATPANTDGLLIPKVDTFPATNPTALQQGMLVHLTTASGANAPGFYYWDNPTLSWISVGSRTGWALSGNPGTVDGTHFVGTTDNVPLSIRVNNQKAGRIDGTLENAVFGYQAANALTSGPQNTVFGNRAYFTATTATGNTAIGRTALFGNTTGNFNTAVGHESTENNTTGLHNTAIGWRSLRQNTTGSNNTALGVGALEFGLISDQNTAVGRGAMINFGTNRQNVAVGFYALANQSFTNGGSTYDSNNTAVGYMSMYSNNPTAAGNGTRNSALGLQSLFSNTIGNANTAVGFQSMVANTTGNGNTAVGDISLVSNTVGNENVAIGGGAAYSNTAASGNVAIGINAMRLQSFNNSNTPFATGNTAVGHNSMFANQPTHSLNGIFNTAMGAYSLDANTTGNQNTAVGHSAFGSSVTGGENTGLGYSAGFHSTGFANTYVGAFSGHGNTPNATGFYNTALGAYSLNILSTAVGNTAVGVSSFRMATTANDNTGLGLNSGYHATGALNTFVGAYAGQGSVGVSNGFQNTAVGGLAMASITSGSANTGIGSNALRSLTTNIDNTAVGHFSGFYATGQQNTFLGTYSGVGANGLSTGPYNTGAGAYSLYSLTSGQGNTALGNAAFRSMTTQNFNTGLGQSAGYNSAGGQNTFIGAYSGFGVVGGAGNANSAVGHRSLQNNSAGGQNTGMGDYALHNNTTGNGNTSLGAGALDGYTTGSDNSGIGRWAGRTFNVPFTGNGNTYLGASSGALNSLGSNNTFVGFQSNVANNGFSYATAIGAGSIANCSNCLTLGGAGIANRTRVGINTTTPAFPLEINEYTNIGLYGIGLGLRYGANTWEVAQAASTNLWFNYNGALSSWIASAGGTYNISDRRFKTDIRPMEPVMEKVMKMQPSRYRFVRNAANVQSMGFIAQDVKAIFPEIVASENTNEGEIFGVDYGTLSTVAIKGLQEHQAEIDEIKTQLKLEQEKNKNLEQLVLQMQQRLENLEKRN